MQCNKTNKKEIKGIQIRWKIKNGLYLQMTLLYRKVQRLCQKKKAKNNKWTQQGCRVAKQCPKNYISVYYQKLCAIQSSNINAIYNHSTYTQTKKHTRMQILTKMHRELYAENFNINEILWGMLSYYKLRDLLLNSWTTKPNIVKIPILNRLIHRFNSISVKI